MAATRSIPVADVAPAALALVEAGYAVLPLWWVRADGTCACGSAHVERPRDPGKHPLGALAAHGYRSASRDATLVARWWGARPGPNVAIRTGDGHVVVDVDARHDGHETLARLEAEHEPLPRDAAVDTPGGAHIYLASTVPQRTRALGAGVELLATGKYAVAPPSVTYGAYRWRSGAPVPLAALPPAPAWLMAARPHSAPAPTAPVRLPHWLPALIRCGERHTMLTRVAGWLRGAGHDEAEILATLTTVRDQRCEHPAEIADAYLERLARYIRTRPAGTRRPDLRAALERVAATWTDRTAVRDRRVLLDAIVPLIHQQGRGEHVHLAGRSVAVLARITRRTATGALRSLEQRGVIRALRRSRPGDDHATEYLLSHLSPTSSGGGGEE